MRSVRPMQVAKTGCIVMSVLFCALGALLLFMPELSASLIGVLIAAMLIVFGLIKLTGYFSRDLYRLAFQYDLAIGILLVALGLMLLTKPGARDGFHVSDSRHRGGIGRIFQSPDVAGREKVRAVHMVADSDSRRNRRESPDLPPRSIRWREQRC